MNQIEEYRDALGGLRFSEEGKERIVKGLMEAEGMSVKGKHFRTLRSALIAAAVCLALLGTAVAAKYFGVEIIEKPDTKWLYLMKGGILYYPYDNLPDEIKSLEGKANVFAFDSWQEAEDFIGVDLMNNPVLDASPSRNFTAKVILGKEQRVSASGKFVLTTTAKLTEFRLFGCYQMNDVNISVDGYLYTDRAEEKDWDETYYGRGHNLKGQDPMVCVEPSYTTPSGLTAQILTLEHEDGHNECQATFSLNGIPFVITTDLFGDVQSHNSLEKDRAQEVLLQVLDGFVLK